jgi:hypothetical protein
MPEKNYEHALNFALHVSIEKLLLCLRVITINSALVTSDIIPGQEIGDLTKLLADVDTLLFLISCQKSHQDKYTTPNKNDIKNENGHTQLREMLHTGCQDTPVPQCTVTSSY